MTQAKIDPALAEELRRAAAQGLPDRPIPVIIEHVTPVPADSRERGGGRAALERRVRELQRPMVERLNELGAGGTVRQHVLANAVSARLTPAQIAALAEHPDVRLIRLIRDDQVTT
jgi:hypothetical protein